MLIRFSSILLSHIIIEKNIDGLIDYLKSKDYKIFLVKEEFNIYRVFNGEVEADVTLLKGNSIEEDLEKLHSAVKIIAPYINFNPFLTLSFLSLPVIPHIKITDKGLFDVVNFKFIDIFE